MSKIFDLITQGNLDEAKELIESKPDVLKETDTNGRTPLHYAVEADPSQNGKLVTPRSFVKHLLENGADPRAADKDGNTALHDIITNANGRELSYPEKNAINLLLDKDQELATVANKDNKTALDIAADNSDKDAGKATSALLNEKTEKATAKANKKDGPDEPQSLLGGLFEKAKTPGGIGGALIGGLGGLFLGGGFNIGGIIMAVIGALVGAIAGPKVQEAIWPEKEGPDAGAGKANKIEVSKGLAKKLDADMNHKVDFKELAGDNELTMEEIKTKLKDGGVADADLPKETQELHDHIVKLAGDKVEVDTATNAITLKSGITDIEFDIKAVDTAPNGSPATPAGSTPAQGVGTDLVR